MLGVTVALLLQTSIVAADVNTYAAAHKQTLETGRPLVVLVGADWCPACQQMKQNVIPQAKRQGLLNRVAFATVNSDQEPGVARQLMRGGSIPQLIMYRKTKDGWMRRQLTGAQSLEALDSFLTPPAESVAEQPQQATEPKPSEAVMGR